MAEAERRTDKLTDSQIDEFLGQVGADTGAGADEAQRPHSGANDNATSTGKRRGRPSKNDAQTIDFETADHSKVTVPRGRKKAHLPEAEAKKIAEALLAQINMVGFMVAGPEAAMTPMETMLIGTPLQQVLQTIPIEQINRANSVVSPILLFGGLVMYSSRVYRLHQQQTVAQTPRDPAAPGNVAPPSATVSDTRTGDIDNLATPVPDIIRMSMGE